MTKTIKLNNVEVSVDEIRQLVKDNPELLKEEEKPLGDDFSMLEYLNDISLGCSVQERKYTVEVNYIKRLNALITIWEWKEKNDGVVVNKDDWCFGVILSGPLTGEGKLTFRTSEYVRMVTNTELPYFSKDEIANRALKELEQEYKVVFNVK